MLEQILSFCVALFLQFITLLSDLMLVPGVSLFAFLAAVFADVGVMILAVLNAIRALFVKQL